MKLANLYQKITDFVIKQSETVQENSTCKKGCSQCCYVDLSVFPIEANHIREWFQSLSHEKKSELIQAWSLPSVKKENFHGEPTLACAFLKNEECTIYDARPLICRTQGLAMQFREEDENFIDICPLNEHLIPEVKDQDILNLDLTNKIISQLELTESGGKIRAREKIYSVLNDLKKL